jgi:putative transcriptional regulator
LASGFGIARLTEGTVDLKRLRTQLAMTQEQFALRYGFELDALQNWEQGRRAPDRATLRYLRVIERMPREAAAAQEEAAT